MIAKMIVAISNQYVEHQPSEQLLQIAGYVSLRAAV
jgi:hypothetical protein